MEQVEAKMGPAEERVFRVVILGRGDKDDYRPLAGYPGVTGYRAQRLYFLQGRLTADEVEQVAQGLLADPVTERLEIGDYQISNLQSLILNLHPLILEVFHVTVHFPRIYNRHNHAVYRPLIGEAGLARRAARRHHDHFPHPRADGIGRYHVAGRVFIINRQPAHQHKAQPIQGRLLPAGNQRAYHSSQEHGLSYDVMRDT
jgi:hypothetical protein